ncbi:hypothetical protein LshimejAT787_1501040 [Lyophyllum shimeji]|uniref:Uncharacterized protein n=1 Tax=Lyophyllum shimeji TaxID=47721 RepID=A0A9P3PVW0_LYOSH|nr:hypothetical protein LshimejAT787_1501040 [Lyophyllum shimeji]
MKEQLYSSDLARRLHNSVKQVTWAKNTNSDLRADRRRALHTAAVQKFRAVNQEENAIQKALNRAHLAPAELYLKDKGVVKNNCREMLRDLASLNVLVNNVGAVIQTVVEGIRMELKDTVSGKTVSRTMKEGGVASEIQIVHKIQQSKGITLSGDGTTIRHRNVESQHGSWEVKSYTAESEEKRQVTRAFGITMSLDHTSETQLHTWKLRAQEFIATYNASPFGQSNPMDVWKFAGAILGLMTDHAADQKKLAQLLLGWKLESIRALEGRKFMEKAALTDLLPVILEENEKKIEQAGGIRAWEKLPEAEKEHRDAETCEKLCMRFGETVWQEFSEDQRRAAALFVWAGCCMHKEQNSVKYGAQRMANYWIVKKLTGPVKLMNRENATAAGAGPSKAQENALEASQGSAVKLTSLAGAVFQHKDDKKG